MLKTLSKIICIILVVECIFGHQIPKNVNKTELQYKNILDSFTNEEKALFEKFLMARVKMYLENLEKERKMRLQNELIRQMATRKEKNIIKELLNNQGSRPFINDFLNQRLF